MLLQYYIVGIGAGQRSFEKDVTAKKNLMTSILNWEQDQGSCYILCLSSVGWQKVELAVV